MKLLKEALQPLVEKYLGDPFCPLDGRVTNAMKTAALDPTTALNSLLSASEAAPRKCSML